MKPNRQEELIALEEYLSMNDYRAVNHHINKAIYCLHFLGNDFMHPTEMQDLCESLYQLGECFYEAQRIEKIREDINL